MLIQKDCIEGMKELNSDSIDCIVTSPPYNKKGLLGNVKLGNQIWGKFNMIMIPMVMICQRRTINYGWLSFLINAIG